MAIDFAKKMLRIFLTSILDDFSFIHKSIMSLMKIFINFFQNTSNISLQIKHLISSPIINFSMNFKTSQKKLFHPVLLNIIFIVLPKSILLRTAIYKYPYNRVFIIILRKLPILKLGSKC